MEANRDQLQAHRGPYFDRWAEACRRAFGVAAIAPQPANVPRSSSPAPALFALDAGPELVQD